eukprot:1303010-Rhodomonas_salina.4
MPRAIGVAGEIKHKKPPFPHNLYQECGIGYAALDPYAVSCTEIGYAGTRRGVKESFIDGKCEFDRARLCSGCAQNRRKSTVIRFKGGLSNAKSNTSTLPRGTNCAEKAVARIRFRSVRVNHMLE